jgi:hypothetical protein
MKKKETLEFLQQRLWALERGGVSGTIPLASGKALPAELENAESGAEKNHIDGPPKPNIRPMRPKRP